jgi:cytochrome c oxidase subunit III
MTVAARAPAAVRRTDEPHPLVLGMVIFIASETMFFAGLFAAYYTLRGLTSPWPPRGVTFTPLEMGQAVVATGILVASSLPAHLSMLSLRRENFGLMRRWVLLTILMGVLFLGWKVHEWSGAAFAISSHAYGTIFFALTGFHALHMAVGLVLLCAVAVRVSQGAYRNGDHAGPEAAVYYWHFVDAVWIGVFATIYLVR